MPNEPRDPHVESAENAGLRYVADGMPGIRRKRVGRGFVYLDVDGQRLDDPDELERIRTLVIPPAWTDVWICPSPLGHIQVTARDGRGRKQYRYHPRYREVRDETKFSRLLPFSAILPAIRERVELDLNREGLPRAKVLATVVRLLEKTLIRVGNDEYAKANRSFGLTTMRQRHVAVTGSRLQFDFRGKSGVPHSISIFDRRLARIVQHCQTLPGQELFQYLDEDGKRQSVDSGDINEYLRGITGREVTAKDFRTWAGTMLAAAALRDLGTATTERELKASIIRAVDQVAKRLGNTRMVCRKYYIHPAVLEAFEQGVVLPATPPVSGEKRERNAPGLRRDELLTLDLIRERRPDSMPLAERLPA